jgi:amino-acid N-acetyltransferase
MKEVLMLEKNRSNRVETAGSRQTMVRKARLTDVNEMHRIINYYADSQLMLPKTQLQLYENLRDYSVAVEEDSESYRMLGCGALHFYWEDLAEIRAVAVAPGMARKGIGTLLVDRLIDEARELEIERVFLFTYEPKFFSRFGFVQVEHSDLPLKVYNECFNCPKFNKCDELAMVLYQ